MPESETRVSAPDGIRVHDAAIEISSQGLADLVQQKGGAVTISRLDFSISEDALNLILAGSVPEGEVPPFAALTETGVRLNGVRDDKRGEVVLNAGSLRISFSAGAVRISTE